MQVITTALEATDGCSQVDVADHDAPRLEDRRAILVDDADCTPVDRDRDELELADHRSHSFLTPAVAVPRPLEGNGAASSQCGLAEPSECLHPLQALQADARDAVLGRLAASMKVEALPRRPWCARQATVKVGAGVAASGLEGPLDSLGAGQVVLRREPVDLPALLRAHSAQGACRVTPRLHEGSSCSTEDDDCRVND